MSDSMESLEQKIRRMVQEDIALTPYDRRWPDMFEVEKAHLLSCLPNGLLRRIEHFGSTAVPGLAGKPIVDLLVEVTSLDAVKTTIVPVLEAQGYDYLWRPTLGDDVPPFYAWFVKRDPATKVRSHHIHMVEADFPQWDSLLFRDYLRECPEAASRYEALKRHLAATYPNDRVAYTRGKTEFVTAITERAKHRRRPV